MIQAIINAFGSALGAVFTFIPHLVGALVILLIGWLVAWLVGKAVTLLLRKVGFDRLSDRIGLTRMEQRMGVRMDTAQLLGRIVFWFLFLIFLVPATDALGLPTVSNTLNAIVNYIPNVFVAILVLVLGALVGVLVGDLVGRTVRATNVGHPEIFAGIARWAIIGFACLVALQQLGIAPALITVLFTAIVGGLALAFGLAFGLGGRESAQRMLSRGESNIMAARPYSPEQIVRQARSDLAHTEQVGQQATPPPSTPAPSPYSTQTQQSVPPTTSGYPGYNEPRPNRPTPPRS